MLLWKKIDIISQSIYPSTFSVTKLLSKAIPMTEFEYTARYAVRATKKIVVAITKFNRRDFMNIADARPSVAREMVWIALAAQQLPIELG
jgi:hypothetical protein